jgi:pantetheine-phosphate adenylyltransferase
MKHKTAIFPGSFDPLTFGHIDIINSALKLFETLIIAVGVNEKKQYMFTVEKRKQFIKCVFKNESRIIVKKYQGLTIDFCEKEKVGHIIRGVRNSSDFEYEQTICLANYELNQNTQTIFLPAKKEHLFISSSLVREIITNNGHLNKKINAFLPKEIVSQILSASKVDNVTCK